jgi:hypothetical protein
MPNRLDRSVGRDRSAGRAETVRASRWDRARRLQARPQQREQQAQAWSAVQDQAGQPTDQVHDHCLGPRLAFARRRRLRNRRGSDGRERTQLRLRAHQRICTARYTLILRRRGDAGFMFIERIARRLAHPVASARPGRRAGQSGSLTVAQGWEMRRRLLTAVDQNGGPDPANRCQGPETCTSRAAGGQPRPRVPCLARRARPALTEESGSGVKSRQALSATVRAGARVADSRLAGQARDPCACVSRVPLLRLPIGEERSTRLLPRDTCIVSQLGRSAPGCLICLQSMVRSLGIIVRLTLRVNARVPFGLGFIGAQ